MIEEAPPTIPAIMGFRPMLHPAAPGAEQALTIYQ
jgi:hypothetical protein